MSCKVYLSLGSNLGNREDFLSKAIERISAIKGIRIEAISSIYETEPVGFLDQPMFLNMAAAVSTSLQPFELLKELQLIENSLDRVREVRWGPRTVDIDILLFEGIAMNNKYLEIPHPRMFQRGFVLKPLKEIYSEKIINGTDIEDLIRACNDKSEVKLYKRTFETFQ